MQTSLVESKENVCPFCENAGTVKFKEGNETITYKCVTCNKKSFRLK